MRKNSPPPMMISERIFSLVADFSICTYPLVIVIGKKLGCVENRKFPDYRFFRCFSFGHFDRVMRPFRIFFFHCVNQLRPFSEHCPASRDSICLMPGFVGFSMIFLSRNSHNSRRPMFVIPHFFIAVRLTFYYSAKMRVRGQ